MRRRRRRRRSSEPPIPRMTKVERLAQIDRLDAIVQKVGERFFKYLPQLVYVNDTYEIYEQYYGNQLIPVGRDTNPTQGIMFANMKVRKKCVDLTIMPCLFLPDLLKQTPSLLALTDRDIRIRFVTEDQVNIEEVDFLLEKGMEAWIERKYII